MTSLASAESVGPPPWFTAAIDAPAEQRAVDVDGATIAYRVWGKRPDAGIVLVHGGAAHARWWDHIAPLLATGRQVVALDLSGHGDSARRDRYSLDQWADEVLAVAAGITTAPTVIGHSMGGFVALRAASRYGSRLAGVVAIDSPVHDITPEERAARDRRAFGPLRVYPSREAAVARFHPIPGLYPASGRGSHPTGAAFGIRRLSTPRSWKGAPAGDANVRDGARW